MERAHPIFERLASIVRDAQLEGTIVAGGPELIAGQLIHAVATGPSNDAMLGNRAYADASAQEAFFERAWALFLRGATRPPAETH